MEWLSGNERSDRRAWHTPTAPPPTPWDGIQDPSPLQLLWDPGRPTRGESGVLWGPGEESSSRAGSAGAALLLSPAPLAPPKPKG